MNTFLKAFKYASIISLFLLIVRSLVSLINIFSNGLIDFPITYATIFIPSFFTILFYNKNSLKSIILFLLKAIITASITSYIFVNIYQHFVYKVPLLVLNFNFLFGILYDTIGNIMTVIITTLIYYLTVERYSQKKETKNTTLPFKKVVLIYITVSIFYILLIGIIYNLNNVIYKLSQITAFGALVTIVIYTVINYCRNRALDKAIKVTLYSLAYIFNIVLIPIIIHYINDSAIPKEGLLGIIEAFTILSVNPTIIIEYYLTITAAIHVYSIYLNNKKEKEDLKQIGVTASLKYQQLKAQLSPHFLFNNISVLTSLIEEDPKKAIHFSENLSNVYRYFLDQEKQDIVTLKEEMVFASKYLNLLKVRYENALTVNNIVINSEDYYILPMALQQVFENVIKHNEISIEHNLTIDISNNKEYLIVTNNLNQKIKPQTNSQTGLENISSRYSFFTDKEVIVIKDSVNYTIKLPLLKIEA